MSSPQRTRSVRKSALVAVGLLALSLTTTALPIDLSSAPSTPYDTELSPSSSSLLATDDGERIPFETLRRPITIQVDIRPTEEQEGEEPSSLALGFVDLSEVEDYGEDDESRNLLVDQFVEVDDQPQRMQEQPSVEEMLQWPYVNLDQFETRSDEQQDEYEA
ncbi:hypothetical protein BGW42_003921 [Actinomortierella wolfii]|nr:hypothetical protein BGW42_003921 [Actinomortierella wolfii]